MIPVVGFSWLMLAAYNGYGRASEKMFEFAHSITEEQREEATRLANEHRSTISSD